jgi:hypothetical protein
MHREYSASYSLVDGVDDRDDTNLLGNTTEKKPPPKSLLRRSPWLSHGVLMSIMMVFFVLWARAPSIDDVVLYCR